jgi:hypothetical protein
MKHRFTQYPKGHPFYNPPYEEQEGRLSHPELRTGEFHLCNGSRELFKALQESPAAEEFLLRIGKVPLTLAGKVVNPQLKLRPIFATRIV